LRTVEATLTAGMLSENRWLLSFAFFGMRYGRCGSETSVPAKVLLMNPVAGGEAGVPARPDGLDSRRSMNWQGGF